MKRDPLAAIATESNIPIDRLRDGGMPRTKAEPAAIRDACDVLGLPAPQEEP